MFATAFVVLLLAFLLVSPFISSMNVSGNQVTPFQMKKISSGLLASDSLTSGNLGSWTIGGDIVVENGNYSYVENSSGLFLGVQNNKINPWIGFYAISPATYANLFNARVTLPYTTESNGSFNTGIYVQTAAISNINYVFCGAEVDQNGYYWSVETTTGNQIDATNYTILYTSPLSSGPLTQDCTIVTNGNNFLQAYIGGSLVYSSQSLSLDIPPPFNVYLEVETMNSQGLLFSNYTDYYSNTLGTVNVIGASPLGTVKLIDSSGSTIATSKVDSSGNAAIPVGSYSLPLSAMINAYDVNGNLTATTSQVVSLWGGDVYAASNSTTTVQSSTSSTTSTSTSASHSTTSYSKSQSTSTSRSESSTSHSSTQVVTHATSRSTTSVSQSLSSSTSSRLTSSESSSSSLGTSTHTTSTSSEFSSSVRATTSSETSSTTIPSAPPPSSTDATTTFWSDFLGWGFFVAAVLAAMMIGIIGILSSRKQK
ncbi:MAG TPA: hypothetical protein VJN71_04505 [Nitrososphaerales archaeon]|nr:hypothetical protein [Nitrososphaerales archaeon]